MSTVLLVIQILLAVGLVGVILIQRNEGGMGGLGGGGGGGGGAGMMTSRSAANLLTRATAVLAALFILNCVALAIVAGVERGSIIDDDMVIEGAATDGTDQSSGEMTADDGAAAPTE